MDIKIAVATHKKYWMPDDPVYIPLHVGHSLNKDKDFGYIGDDTGDNISDRNERFCELTGLYWVWKNLKADFKGLVHYRRHFTRRKIFSNKKAAVYTKADFEKILSRTKILLPNRRNYYIETNQSHYAHAHYISDLQTTRAIVEKRRPEYLPVFDRQMERTGAHMFNMMVMRTDYFDAYCEWLFPILFEVESSIDISGYDAFQRRVYGYLSELLLDVWIETNRLPYREVSVSFMEPQNWVKKGGKFLWRKWKG